MIAEESTGTSSMSEADDRAAMAFPGGATLLTVTLR
jgi:hypothetical protein